MLEAYRAAPDKSAALETLASTLLQKKNDKDLAAILDEHARDHAADPALACFKGELCLLRGDAKQAEIYFAASLAKTTSPILQWRPRNGLNRARVKAGHVADAYRDGRSDKSTFVSLAYLCREEKDARQLQVLIDAHRAVLPEDANLIIWDVEVLWLKRDYEGAVMLLTEKRQDDLFARTEFRWRRDDYLVRSLVKLKRTADAIREAERVAKPRYGSVVLLTFAHAAAGDVKQAMEAVERRRAQPWLVRSCYQDTDLGPLLRSEPFKAFRAKYPEPIDDPQSEERDGDER
jgi:hypothetical protein